MEIGDPVHQVDGNLYGVIISVDDFTGAYRVRWQLTKHQTLTLWEEPEKVHGVDAIPVRIGKVRFKQLAVDLKPIAWSWADDAKCIGQDTDDFIYGSEMPTDKQRAKLMSICEGCRVQMECRYEAVRNLEQGWWGNMDEKQRFEWAVATVL
jgi:hypothetical protein